MSMARRLHQTMNIPSTSSGVDALFHFVMAEDSTTRLANFQALWDRHGWSPSVLVKRCGSSASQWSDLYHGRKSFGEKLARKIEQGMGLNRLELDDTLGAATRVAKDSHAIAYAGKPRTLRPTPVVGTARLGDGGYYEEIPQGDGFVDSYSEQDAYALRVKGDSMHPAIRHGWFVVVTPNQRCTAGEYVAIALTDGSKMVKELVIEREHEVVVESVNGNTRQTIERSDIEQMHPVSAVVPASKWRAK